MSKTRNIADLGSNDVLDTNANGIDVTGTVTADGLTVENTVTNIDLLESDVADQNTRLQSSVGKFNIRTANDALSSFTTRMQIEHSTGDISFYEDTGTTPKLFWDASAESLGIGTTSPRSDLEIQNSAGGELTLRYTGNSGFAAIKTNASSEILFSTNQTSFQEKMRLDNSGNLLVGKTSATTTTSGVEARANGLLGATRSGTPAILNRLSTDGTILVAQKDGSTVGSIGNSGANLYIEGNTSGKSGLEFGGTAITPRDSGAVSDGVNDLGSSVNRFKDLYLSGGVYLGGTGAANKLDDYEEGTWTPEYYAGGSTMTATYDNVVYGTYQKIGNAVYFNGCIRTDSITVGSSSDTLQISGLPFAPVSGTYGGGTERWAVTIGRSIAFPSINPKNALVGNGFARIELYQDLNANTGILANGVTTNANSNQIEFSGMYRTA